MTYAITQSCCADASCVSACPVNCIHPAPGEPGFGTTDMLHIDPVTCIDCGACADACPVDAAQPADQLTGPLAVYVDRNREYFQDAPHDGAETPPRYPRSLPAAEAPRGAGKALRIAVVGTGPAAGYTVRELLRCTDAEITLIDRQPVAGGLVRFGVAPDHPATKRIGDGFAVSFRHPRVSAHLGVGVGRDISHADILRHHHAVVYATGADSPRALGISGEDLPGSLAATEFLAWCNGRPGASVTGIGSADAGRTGRAAEAGRADQTRGAASAGRTRRAVVVGTGNVAIDVARLLLSDPRRLAATGIPGRVLAALRESEISEVVLLGRRGPADAAYSPKEFLGLRQLPGVRIVVDGDASVAAEIAAEIAAAERHSRATSSPASLLRDIPVEKVDWTAPPATGPRLVLRFHSAPLAALGADRLQAVRVTDTADADGMDGAGGTTDADGTNSAADAERDIPADLLIRAIGSRAAPIPGLPFDPGSGVIPNTAGRIRPGSYVVGWAKRGAVGGIGANRACAAETVGALLDDATAGRLPSPPSGPRAFARLTRRAR